MLVSIIMDGGIFIDDQFRGYTIVPRGFFVQAPYSHDPTSVEYAKDLKAFLDKWYGKIGFINVANRPECPVDFPSTQTLLEEIASLSVEKPRQDKAQDHS